MWVEEITMIELATIIFCHLVGDYPLQQDFIANTKGSNLYHLFVHCALYCIPFAISFGIDIRLLILFATHFLVDMLKARYKAISYGVDQTLHYLVALVLYLIA